MHSLLTSLIHSLGSIGSLPVIKEQLLANTLSLTQGCKAHQDNRYNINMKELVTIGKLARRVGLRPSALRYYESEGLLEPAQRSPAGYRLYAPQAEQTLRFIQRAQRLGFSLADIHVLLHEWQTGKLKSETLQQMAQERYFDLERQMTQNLVLQHELGLFLQDLRDNQQKMIDWDESFDQFLEKVCANPLNQPDDDTFEWLLQQTGCELTTPQGREILQALAGLHTHIWQQDDSYHILLISQDEAVGKALQMLAALEAHCSLHTGRQNVPLFLNNDEGFLLKVTGENAFVFVRLFLMLEKMGTNNGANKQKA